MVLYLCLHWCLHWCRKSRRLWDRFNAAEKHVFVFHLWSPFLRLNSWIWPAISSTWGPHCRLDALGRPGKSGARLPCCWIFVKSVLSVLWDLSCFVYTLGLELLCLHFRTWIFFLDTLRGSSSLDVVSYCSSKTTLSQTQLWFFDSMLAPTTRALILLDHVLIWLTDVTTLQACRKKQYQHDRSNNWL